MSEMHDDCEIKNADWEILNGACPELSGTKWENKPEYCPTLYRRFRLITYALTLIS